MLSGEREKPHSRLEQGCGAYNTEVFFLQILSTSRRHTLMCHFKSKSKDVSQADCSGSLIIAFWMQ